MTGWGLDVLFNPSKRHMDEEKRRLQSTREEIGDASGGKRIDLESGKVVIARSSNTDTETHDAGADDTDTDAAESGVGADAARRRATARRRAIARKRAAAPTRATASKRATASDDKSAD